MKLLINFATYRRRNAFLEAMENLQYTISNDADYEVIVSADYEDSAMDDNQTIGQARRFKNTSIYFGEHISKVTAINRFVHKAKPDWNILVNLSDDFRFTQKDWDKQIISDAKEFFPNSTDFLLHYPDGYVNERLPTMQVIGKQWYDRTGEVYPSIYNSVSCDADEYYRSILLGKYKYIDKHLFVHNHPANIGGIKTDATYWENDKFENGDTKIYRERMKRYFDVPKEQIVHIPEQLQKEIDNLK